MCEVYLRDVRRAVALTWWLIASPEMNFLFLGTAAHLFHSPSEDFAYGTKGLLSKFLGWWKSQLFHQAFCLYGYRSCDASVSFVVDLSGFV